MQDNELRDAAEDWANALFPAGAPVQDAPDDELEDDADELEADGGEGVGEDSGDLSNAEYTELSEAFWASLDDASRQAAERSPTARDGLWRAYTAGLGAADDGAVDEPPSGFDVLAYVIENPDELVDGTGARINAAEWIAGWVDANPRDWAQACVEAGWPAATKQPSHLDVKALGRGAQGAVLAASYADMVKADREAGRHW